ncbi:MAG: methyltransferase domain-containing protein [Proteobacteria bacterium]|nr:methyltransferase domain-containing protein [Pseudomonadota bacterium]
MKSKQAFFTALGGRVRFTRGCYNITSDPVWLAAFAATGHQPTTTNQRPPTNDHQPTTNDHRPTTTDQRPATNDQKVLDVGVGTGGAALCLLEYSPGLKVTGIDISESMLAECAGNAALNGRAIELIHADIMNWRTSRTFDIVITNPPYFKGTPRKGKDGEGNIHHNINLYDWTRASLKRARPRGRFYCITDARATVEIIAALRDGRAGEVTIIPLFGSHVGANNYLPLQKFQSAERILISARPGARGGTKILAGMSMNDERILRMETELNQILNHKS